MYQKLIKKITMSIDIDLFVRTLARIYQIIIQKIEI